MSNRDRVQGVHGEARQRGVGETMMRDGFASLVVGFLALFAAIPVGFAVYEVAELFTENEDIVAISTILGAMATWLAASALISKKTGLVTNSFGI